MNIQEAHDKLHIALPNDRTFFVDFELRRNSWLGKRGDAVIEWQVSVIPGFNEECTQVSGRKLAEVVHRVLDIFGAEPTQELADAQAAIESVPNVYGEPEPIPADAPF